MGSELRTKFLRAAFSPLLAPLRFFDFLSGQKASLWTGSKGVARKKHRPSYFGLRISDFGFFCFPFSIRIPQSTIRNLEAGTSGARSRASRDAPTTE